MGGMKINDIFLVEFDKCGVFLEALIAGSAEVFSA
jgi:hypothetical protein